MADQQEQQQTKGPMGMPPAFWWAVLGAITVVTLAFILTPALTGNRSPVEKTETSQEEVSSLRASESSSLAQSADQADSQAETISTIDKEEPSDAPQQQEERTTSQDECTEGCPIPVPPSPFEGMIKNGRLEGMTDDEIRLFYGIPDDYEFPPKEEPAYSRNSVNVPPTATEGSYPIEGDLRFVLTTPVQADAAAHFTATILGGDCKAEWCPPDAQHYRRDSKLSEQALQALELLDPVRPDDYTTVVDITRVSGSPDSTISLRAEISDNNSREVIQGELVWEEGWYNLVQVA